MLVSYYPEMQQAKPADSQIEATLGHYGGHYYLRTQLEMKGRGITLQEILKAEVLIPGSKYVGWKKYKVTEKAFDSLCQTYVVSMETLL